jgi:hypothetical protein
MKAQVVHLPENISIREVHVARFMWATRIGRMLAPPDRPDQHVRAPHSIGISRGVGGDRHRAQEPAVCRFAASCPLTQNGDGYDRPFKAHGSSCFSEGAMQT